MYLIDARRKVNYDTLHEFINKHTNKNSEVEVIFDGDDEPCYKTTVENIQNVWMEQSLEDKVNEKGETVDVTLLSSEDIAYVMIGLDITWWRASYRRKPLGRLLQLFVPPVDAVKRTEEQRNADAKATISTGRKVATEVTAKLACGVRKDTNITDVETFEGNPKDMKVFINKYLARNHLRSFGRAITVFCVNYKYDGDLNDIDNWKTFDELVEQGVFTK